MTKKTTDTPEVIKPIEIVPIVFKNRAFSITKNAKTQKWHVVTIDYNEDGTTGNMVVQKEGMGKQLVIERFKVEVENSLLGD